MAELKLNRRFDAPPEVVFDFVTEPELVLSWWGHDGTTLPDAALDFRAPGPWHSVMEFADGRRMKMSGQVTRVDRPRRVAFTWAWHDEADRRGRESHVAFDVAPDEGGGSVLTLTHADLPDAEWASRHERGWGSTLGRLARRLDRKVST